MVQKASESYDQLAWTIPDLRPTSSTLGRYPGRYSCARLHLPSSPSGSVVSEVGKEATKHANCQGSSVDNRTSTDEPRGSGHAGATRSDLYRPHFLLDLIVNKQ